MRASIRDEFGLAVGVIVLVAFLQEEFRSPGCLMHALSVERTIGLCGAAAYPPLKILMICLVTALTTIQPQSQCADRTALELSALRFTIGCELVPVATAVIKV